MRNPSAVLVAVALVVVPLVAEFDAGELRARATAALATIDGEITVDGLSSPVEVIRDRWGVPHIYAKTLDDLFLAQGFVAAQDRLWQLEIWKRTAEGRLAELLGPSAVDRDVFARLLRYRGDPEAEWASYAPEARRIVEAFVRGVNQQVDLVNAQPEKLPVEFQMTGTRPSLWTPETVISRMAGYAMTRNADTEVSRALLAQRVGTARVAEWMPPDPAVAMTVPEGLALSDITSGVLTLADAAEAPLSLEAFAASKRAAGGRAATVPAFGLFSPRRPPPPAPPSVTARLESLADRVVTIGSNNWVVAGSRSTSGKPLLANDPHRAITLPSLRYTVHLNGPGWNVIGAGEPAVPGVAAGHNDRVAFGFTIVGIDQQDLYVEQLDPADHGRYRYRGQWEALRVEREELRVAGEAVPRTIELRFTRHGPVIHVDSSKHRAFALRWVGSEPGTAGYLASLSLNVARSWPEFLAAAERWKVPSENLIYADVDGNIGWVAAGMAPIRPNWNGLLPVPGHEGRFEWTGFLRVDELPQAFNPRQGFIATANHNILPRNYPRMLGYEWSPPHRYRRIVEVLARPGTFSVADFERLQHDEASLPARAIVDALRVAATVAPPATPERAAAVRALLAWDGVLDQHSGAAALYALWLPHLRRAFAQATTADADRAVAPDAVTLERLLDLLRKPTQAHLALLVGDALGAALADARRLMGDDQTTWAWGRIHRAHFTHPLAFDPAAEAVMSLPPVPRGGDATTINNTGAGLRQVHGASFREVIDLGDWDKSTAINVPGASGQPASRFYDSLLPLWSAGNYHPLVFSRAAVERAAAARLWLRPSGWKAPLGPSAVESEGVPALPAFLGTLVNFDRAAGRLAACTREAGADLVVGSRKVARTYVWVVEREQARQLGSTPGSCDPAWSPDGSRLAVVTLNGLWTYSPELEEPRQLAGSDSAAFSRPRWSPDGQRLAYIVTDGATSWVEVVAVATGRPIYRSDPDTYTFEWTVDPRVLKVGPRQVRLP